VTESPLPLCVSSAFSFSASAAAAALASRFAVFFAAFLALLANSASLSGFLTSFALALLDFELAARGCS
jgi:hypothetical protein